MPKKKRARLTDDESRAFDEAMRLRELEDYEPCIRMLTELRGRHPDHGPVTFMLAAALFEVDRFDDCVVHAERAVSLSPRSELASRLLVHALFSVSRFEEAFEEVARFRSRFPSEEYDRALAEWQDGIVEELAETPLDAERLEFARRVRMELARQPIRH